jgi:heme-degrading monooxygenase HmoA
VIAFRIRFTVRAGREDDFVAMIVERYQPGLARQHGFVATRLLRVYEPTVLTAIGATPDVGDDDHAGFVLEFEFETEDDRMAWVNGPDHDELWNAAVGLTTDQRWCGYDVVHQQSSTT